MKKITSEEKRKYLGQILINLNKDYTRLGIVLNAYRYGRGEGVDNVGGYEMNISEALILSKLYFSDLTSEIEEYSEFIKKRYTMILLKGFLTLQKGNETTDRVEEMNKKVIESNQASDELYNQYNKLEEKILNKFKEL